MSGAATGVVYVHAIPRALCPHLEWLVAGALGRQLDLDWSPAPALPTHRRARADWWGPAGSAAAVVSAVRPWGRVRLEMTEDPSPGRPGERYSLTPSLGIFRAGTNEIGDIVVAEDRLRGALASDDVATAIDTLLGGPWDRELEVFRMQEAAEVRAAALG